MAHALREAELAFEEDEVPVGAVVVVGDRIVGRGHNQRERLNDPTAHAEMIALTAAADAVGSWRLEGAVMYVTLEPCPMCAGALQQARIARVVFGAADMKAGACGSLYSLGSDPRLGRRAGPYAGGRDAEPDRGAALGDRRRRHVHRQVRSSRGADG